MQLKTILNHVQKFKSFVYGRVTWHPADNGPRIEVEVHERVGSRPICAHCGRRSAGYDRQPVRRFEFVPMWGIRVFFLYAPRRVDCRCCGVHVERMPWALGKQQLTTTYAWYLARWARRLSWTETARAFQTSWHHVFASVEMAVRWGREHQSLEGVTAIGIDEIAWRKGHKYLTLVYQIDAGCKRLLWIGKDRKVETLEGFFTWYGVERSKQLRYVCSDMWKPYLKVIAAKASTAIHVLDRFHIVAHLNKAIDETRAAEHRALKAEGHGDVLKNARWGYLKRPENLTGKQVYRMADLLRMNLKTTKSWLAREHFERFWEYKSPHYAGLFLDSWCTMVMRSRLEPMKRVAKMLRKHRALLLNWHRAKGMFSSGVVEGFNTKAKLTSRMAYGFRTFHGASTALYHSLGNLPEPKVAHRFF